MRVMPAIAALLSFTAIGCSWIHKPSWEFNAWAKVQKDYAKAFDGLRGGPGLHYQWAGEGGSFGDIYDEGRKSVVMSMTLTAQRKQSAITGQPRITSSTVTDLGAKAPGVFKNVFAQAGIKATDTFYLQYTDLKEEYVIDGGPAQKGLGSELRYKYPFDSRDVFKAVEDFPDHPKKVIRGYVTGKLRLVSTKGFNANATAGPPTMITDPSSGGKVNVTFDQNGGYEIVDTSDVVQFLIYGTLRADPQEKAMWKSMTDQQRRDELENNLKKYLE